ncbi:MAG: class I SAM-dependent methyltransferase [Filomicrobium sp.]
MSKWDDKYAGAPEGLFGVEPNSYLEQVAQRSDFTAKSGICLADGDGRNSRWLARRGLSMTALDLSGVAAENGRKLDAAAGVLVERIAGDVAHWNPDPGRQWDAAFQFYLQAPAAERLAGLHLAEACVRPGGWIVVEGFSKQGGGDDLGPQDPELLYSQDELLSAFQDVETLELLSGVVRLDEGGRHQGLGGVVRFCGRKR